MEKLFGYAEEYIKQSDWRTLAALKLCLASLGILIGMALPEKSRKYVKIIASAVFAVTYVPLMAKFFRIAADKPEDWV